MLVIALTGGIGSGKSTVSEIFKSKNVPIIDTDIIARKIVEQGEPAYEKIIEEFGKEVLNKDKSINRQTLGKIIFSSDKDRLQLENILHPLIWDDVKTQLEKITASSLNTPPYCIVVVPLLVENLSKTIPVNFNRILVIDTDEELQIARTKKRDGCDDSIIRNIIKSQVSRQTRIDAADDIILNTGNLNYLDEQVENLHKQYHDLSKKLSK